MPNVIICGSCVVDLPCLSVDLHSPIQVDRTLPIEPIAPTCGGITCNVGIALQRLGMEPGVLSFVGDDTWGEIIRQQLSAEGVCHHSLLVHPTAPTTAVAVLVDTEGNRSFLAPGVTTATKFIDADFLRANHEAIEAADWFVLGYFGRMPRLEPDLAATLKKIRESGIRTVMDCAGDGGTWSALEPALPDLDVFVPSLAEARGHSGLDDPAQILERYRQGGATGVIGIKLGAQGALLSAPGSSEIIAIEPVAPPGPVIDTTGAGDLFIAGLITGLDAGLPLAEAGRLAAAAGACAVTGRGGYSGLSDAAAVRKLAGLG